MPAKAMSRQTKSKGSKLRRLPPQPRFTYVPPQSKRVRLTFVNPQAAITEAAAGAGASHVFRLNGTYDVDTSLGSTAVPGFAEHAAFFSGYRVWSAAVKLVGTVTGGSTGSFAHVGFYPNATNTFLSGAGAAVSWLVAPNRRSTLVVADSSRAPAIANIQASFSLPAIARITKQQYAIDMDYSATTVSVPSRQIQLAVFVNSTGSSSVVTLNYAIWVEMEVEFFNPVQLAS